MNASSQRWASRVSSAAFHSANTSSTHGSVNVGSLVPTPETTRPGHEVGVLEGQVDSGSAAHREADDGGRSQVESVEHGRQVVAVSVCGGGGGRLSVTSGVDEDDSLSVGERGHLRLPHPVVQPAAVQEHQRASRSVVRPDGQVALGNADVGSHQSGHHDTQGVTTAITMSTEVS